MLMSAISKRQHCRVGLSHHKELKAHSTGALTAGLSEQDYAGHTQQQKLGKERQQQLP